MEIIEQFDQYSDNDSSKQAEGNNERNFCWFGVDPKSDIVEYHFGGKEEERIYEMYPIIHEVLLIVIVLFAEG